MCHQFPSPEEAPQQTLAERQRLLDASLDVICSIDQTGRFVIVSAASEWVWGYKPEELRGRPYLELVLPEDHERTRDAAARIMAGEPMVDFENRYRRKDGSIVHVLWSATWMPGEQLMYGVARDATERRRAQEECARMADRLRQTLESITEAVVAFDGEWRFTLLNAAAERLVRQRREELLGKCVWDEFPEAVGGPFYAAYHRCVREQRMVEFEEYYAPLESWLNVRAYPTPEGLVAYVRDVTERKRDERMRSLLASIVESSGDAIFSTDLDGVVTSWNRAAERIFGYAAAEMIGRRRTVLLPEDEPAGSELPAAGEEGVQIETRRRRKDGAIVDVLLATSPLRDEGGKVVGASRIARDITERKRLEAQFLRAQRMESIGTLAGGIAHDLNNVLGPIITALDLLRLEVQETRALELLEILASNAGRAAAMVTQVLSFARGVEGQRVSVSARYLLEDLKRIVTETFPKNIEIKTAYEPGLPALCGDPTQLHQVLLNLCVNARDAMPTGGRLSISAKAAVLDQHYAEMSGKARAGTYVLLEVEDAGTGISPEILEKIFDPFFTTKEVGKGTGLGLSTAHAIVRSHGGMITVYSEPGRGTTFRVYLPAADTAAPETRTETPVLIRGHGETILVVDDEDSIRRISGQTLQAFGYRVRLAADGAEALAEYAAHRDEIAAILTDMNMPVLDGVATIRALRKLNPAVPIIAASGISNNADVTRAAGLGVKHFLPKPYTAEQMLSALADVLERK